MTLQINKGDSLYSPLSKNMERKAYLGDSVYAELDQFGTLILTTENGYPNDPRNQIVLNPEVLAKLQRQFVLKAVADQIEADIKRNPDVFRGSHEFTPIKTGLYLLGAIAAIVLIAVAWTCVPP